MSRRDLGTSAFPALVLLALVSSTAHARAIRVEPVSDNHRAPVLSVLQTRATSGGCVCDSTWADSTLYRLELPAPVFEFGDTVRMVYTITNQSSQTRIYEFPTTCQRWFAVYPGATGPNDPGAESVWEPPWGCGQAPSFFELAPSQSKVFTLDWRQHIYRRESLHYGYPVEPGSYTAWGGLDGGAEPREETLVPVPFEIVPHGPRVIQEALDAAAAGDTVFVAPGIYYENLKLLPPHEGVVLMASGPAGDVVLDGGGRGSVIYANDVDGSTMIQGFTIRNGRNGDGEDHVFVAGGISLLLLASPAIRDNVFRGNMSDYGGAILAHYAANSLIKGNLFLDNSATWAGGAIYAPGGVYGPRPTVQRNTFVGNSAFIGGAMSAGSPGSGPAMLVSSNIFFGNVATDAGGGLMCYPSPDPVDRCNAFWANEPNDRADCGSPTDPVFADPLFCDVATEDFTLQEGSPCAPANNPECGLIGAFDVNCATISIPPPTSDGSPFAVGPNPFLRAVEFQFQALAGDVPARLEIFAISGRRVWSRDVTAATELRWDGRDEEGREVAPGVYFVHVRRDDLVLGTGTLVRMR